MQKTKNINHKKYKKSQGFTLIELMIAISVAVVLMAVAVPSFTNLIARNTVTSDSNEFIIALNLTRSEAIKRNRDVEISAKTGSWNNGYIIDTVDDEGNTLTIQNYSTPKFATPPIETNTPTINVISFSGSGLLVSPTPTFTVCKTSGESGTQIDISTTGRITSTQINCP